MSLQLQQKPTFFDRMYDLQDLLQLNKVLVLYGPRQVGKTSLVNILYNQKKYKTFFGTGDDNKLIELFNIPDFDKLINFAKNYELIIIDEAQLIKNIGKGLKIIVDYVPDVYIIVTGSASFELAGQIGEPLVGRKKTYTLFPLSIMEIKKYFAPELFIDEFLLYGGYPEVIVSDTIEQKKEILYEIINSYLLKDILTLEKVKNPKVLKDLLKLLAWQIGSEVSLRELSNSLNIDYKTVARYLDLLEKSFIITSLHGYSRNLRKEVTKSRKYYFYDIGIRNAIIGDFNEMYLRQDRGAIWENFLYIERLKKQEYKKTYVNYYFWRTWDQKEIDLVEEKEGMLYGYEFKWSDKKKTKEPKLWRETYPEAKFQVIDKNNYIDFIS